MKGSRATTFVSYLSQLNIIPAQLVDFANQVASDDDMNFIGLVQCHMVLSSEKTAIVATAMTSVDDILMTCIELNQALAVRHSLRICGPCHSLGLVIPSLRPIPAARETARANVHPASICERC